MKAWMAMEGATNAPKDARGSSQTENSGRCGVLEYYTYSDSQYSCA